MFHIPSTLVGESRHLALCYIRQSYTRDELDRNSANRQQANALTLCTQRGWTPLLFVEADGHRSAYWEENRPEWLRLKDWLTHPQVVAVVANDPSRLYRKMWRMGSFLETLDRAQVQLLFASPGSPIRDISNPADRFILQMYALMDESYVHDLARRQKDSIAFRRREGKTTGIPPFGVVRDAQGYLMPSPLGAWLLPDGSTLAGYRQDEPPTPSSEWRGYYDCTYRILSLYASSDTGREKLAQRLNGEGWRFKDRWGQPRPLQEDDIRRVICNWAEYGGIVRDRRAKDVPLYELDGVVSPFVPERAVFPIELLRQVVTIARARSFRQNQHGKAPHYEAPPLAGLCYCAHCEAAAKPEQGRHYRPRLGTAHLFKQTSYRHRSNVKCSTLNHSIPAAALEHQVGRLIDMLVMSQTHLKAFQEAASAAQPSTETAHRQSLIAGQERIERLKLLYLSLEIDEAQYQTRMVRYRQELEHLKAAVVSPTDFQVQLDYCAAKLVMLQEAWCSGTILERRTTLHGVFEEIVIDLDTRRITAFRLKAWAADYLKACASHLSEQGTAYYGQATNPDQALLRLLYHEAAPEASPINRAAKQARNHSLCERYSAGETLEDLSRAYGITPQRVHQIVHGHRK